MRYQALNEMELENIIHLISGPVKPHKMLLFIRAKLEQQHDVNKYNGKLRYSLHNLLIYSIHK
jgi:hypothetical protein